MSKILISSCLLGLKVKWDESSKDIPELHKLVNSGQAIFLCPEQLAGFATPREPAEIEFGKTAKDVLEGNAKVLTKSGADVTGQFVKAAKYTLEMCRKSNVTVAILRSNSPSCGSIQTYDGSFSGKKINGNGVTAELLKQNGIKVYDEENYQGAALWLSP